MSTLAIELNDAGITTLADDERPGGEAVGSPGFAVVDGSTIVTGREALDQARLKPRRTHHRFWSQLDDEPIGRPFPTGLSPADLAYAHLSSVWQRVGTGVDRAVVALPGSHTAQRMGLILGIAQACEIPIVGLVDAAVAAAATVSTGGGVLHLDLELNGVVLTQMTSARELVRERVLVGDHTGWVRLRDAWARRVARSFVTRTRFDPLHVATTEQELHGRLPELLTQLRRQSSGAVRLEAGGRVHTVEVLRDDLVEAVASDYDGLLQLVEQSMREGQPGTVLLSDRTARLPGFEERLAEVVDAEVVALPRAAAARGALRHVEFVRSPGEAVSYVTRLTLRSPPPPPVGEPSAPSVAARPVAVEQPTHIVHDGRAYRLTGEPFVVGTAIPEGSRGLTLAEARSGLSPVHCSVYPVGDAMVVEDRGSTGSFLNGQRVDGTTLAGRGDRLTLGASGVELQFITVTDEDAPPRD